MHRSGTSVVAGLLDRLGLDGGPRSSMVAADEFNGDGYWEQRPIVEWHNSVLTQLGGWPSAPPEPPEPPPAGGAWAGLAGTAGASLASTLAQLYHRHWFVKDPRQCLLLGLWTELRGHAELAVVVSRTPHDVIRSLQQRNGYSSRLAAALWERYNHDLVLGLAGRPCLWLRYEDITARPAAAVASLVDTLERRSGPASSSLLRDPDRLAAAEALVRPAKQSAAASGGAHLTAEQDELDRILVRLGGYHGEFQPPDDLPALSAVTVRTIARRRSQLRLVTPLLPSSSQFRAILDRVPTRLRDRTRGRDRP